MGETTAITWCDRTFNPWVGCTKVSPGCANCYAERDFGLRKGIAKWGPGQPRHRTSEANWRKPLAWDRKRAWEERDAEACGRDPGPRPRVFCASLADWLDAEVPVAWLFDLLDLIRRTPHLDWLLLSKRPENFDRLVKEAQIRAEETGNELLDHWLTLWLNDVPPANVWIGTTAESQEWADRRIPELLKIPARIRFISAEPLLGRVDLTSPLLSGGIHWVICGGESGPAARPMHPGWARFLRDQCALAKVPFHFKQWGEWADPDAAGFELQTCRGPDGQTAASIDGRRPAIMRDGLARAGKHVAGRRLDGREHNEFPLAA